MWYPGVGGMKGLHFTPTPEQMRIINHSGSAFVAACPGSGKTRVLVERARALLTDRTTHRGIALLSFTTAAVSELEQRLRTQGLLPTPPFPHFIGTFDAFLWQFLIAPFGVPGCITRPRLIPDKDQQNVIPFPNAQPLPLECFERLTGATISGKPKKFGFSGRSTKSYETAAYRLHAAYLGRGELDFADARELARDRLQDPGFSPVLAQALSARFRELFVDEAQDCNPCDLDIIDWFRNARIPVKVICDPHQSIYGFRGGVGEELLRFANSFPEEQRLPLTGNFRSSQHITQAIVALRAPHSRTMKDAALGELRDDPTPVYVLRYKGRSVPASVGSTFRGLTEGLGLNPRDCPVVAATRAASANALGRPLVQATKDLTYRLAVSICDYHFSFELGGRKEALENVHKVVVELQGHITDKTYHQYMSAAVIDPGIWRPQVLRIVEALRYDPNRHATPEQWHDDARRFLAPVLPAGGRSIRQHLRANKALGEILMFAPPNGHSGRTIHSVKGMEFPAVCVVMSSPKIKGILDYLSNGSSTENSEDARKLYVGASRAKRLLVIAAPEKHAPRLIDLLRATGASITSIPL
jgi:DNA helicase-2/ATP-dependent DNA helicase PcrA